MRALAEWRLDIEADFAEVLIGFLIFERLHDLAQREVTINHRAHAVGIDGTNHVLLMGTAVHQ